MHKHDAINKALGAAEAAFGQGRARYVTAFLDELNSCGFDVCGKHALLTLEEAVNVLADGVPSFPRFSPESEDWLKDAARITKNADEILGANR